MASDPPASLSTRRPSRPADLLVSTSAPPALDGAIELTYSPEVSTPTSTSSHSNSTSYSAGTESSASNSNSSATASTVQQPQPQPQPPKSVAFSASPLRHAHTASPTSIASPTLTGRLALSVPRAPHAHLQHTHSQPVPTSPCFVHSLLDKGVSFADWLKENSAPPSGAVTPLTPPPGALGYQSTPNLPSALALPGQPPLFSKMPGQDAFASPPYLAANGILGVGGLPRPMMRDDGGAGADELDGSVETEEEDEDEEGGESLTKQLADTAVGVREMSKQLGRVRVRSNIQSILVVTKARDNNLVKLTRQLALYLMLKKRETGRGLIVYVDSQLRHSRRFDAAGIEREHPELFTPVARRRSSSATSLVSLSEGSGSASARSTSALSSLGSERRRDRDEGQLRYWTSEMCTRSPHLFDFVVTLGGDGTVLFTSWLFQRIVPPVLPFALGSLGFLTNFDFADHEPVMDSVIDSGIRVNLRMRFTCTVYRSVHREDGDARPATATQRAMKKGSTGEIIMKYAETEGWQALESGFSMTHPPTGSGAKDKEIRCLATKPVETFEILNDLVVDRGPSPYMSMLELFADEHHLTTVQADGLVIATPTGSTAYSLSAGGSLVHPEIPALLISPICPHTLSFRPMLLPDSMELRICVPYNSRSTAWASFDGRGRVELKQGDHIKVTASRFPFPTVCADKQSTDWFHAISRTLKWNERERQKSFVVVEEPGDERSRRRSGPAKENGETARLHATSKPPQTPSVPEAEEGDEDADEDGKFDIDDSSGDAQAASLPASSAVSPRTPAEPDPLSTYVSHMHLPDSQAHSKSGIETPGRYAGPHGGPTTHPPRNVLQQQRAHHPQRADGVAAGAGAGGAVAGAGAGGADTLRTPRPEDRTLVTASGGATGGHVPSPPPGPHHHQSQSQSQAPAQPQQQQAGRKAAPGTRAGRDASVGRRAFAVYGQDESDSGTSGSED